MTDSSQGTPSTLQLILWPTILTALVNAARVVSQLEGFVGTASGGGLAWLGITWLPFVFGPWMALRLARAGAHPRVRPAILWTFLGLAALLAAVFVNFRPIDRAAVSDEAYAELRRAVANIVMVAIPIAIAMLVFWTRLAWALLVYGLIARATVLGVTWLAKVRGWDTHYTKFGPGGIERDGVGETIFAASIAQLGFWVPFTIAAGCFAGTVAVVLFGRSPRAR